MYRRLRLYCVVPVIPSLLGTAATVPGGTPSSLEISIAFYHTCRPRASTKRGDSYSAADTPVYPLRTDLTTLTAFPIPRTPDDIRTDFLSPPTALNTLLRFLSLSIIRLVLYLEPSTRLSETNYYHALLSIYSAFIWQMPHNTLTYRHNLTIYNISIVENLPVCQRWLDSKRAYFMDKIRRKQVLFLDKISQNLPLSWTKITQILHLHGQKFRS